MIQVDERLKRSSAIWPGLANEPPAKKMDDGGQGTGPPPERGAPAEDEFLFVSPPAIPFPRVLPGL